MSWEIVVSGLVIAAGGTVKAWFALQRYRIGQVSETHRFSKALEGVEPQDRAEIIRAYNDKAVEDPAAPSGSDPRRLFQHPRRKG
ncbi:hypothetical protein JOD54_001565 [Actinokineospora baliensis]|uniref:hypothetical protein n=1 Tax=Actinokineospora baliensis TaxID=547056 RepID=UPI00195D851B|nr:hypothetical protein [Actinokineospora baliensis]MBM7771361.1 hypothetical protein [Actinokineospora baliensis]